MIGLMSTDLKCIAYGINMKRFPDTHEKQGNISIEEKISNVYI